MTAFPQLPVFVGDYVVAVEKLPDQMSVKQYIRYNCQFSERDDVEDPFFVVDLSRVINVHTRWEATLPNVQPFYAVKCNDDVMLLKTLAALGTGFDCASKNEIKRILDLGVSPDRIIYANPCKQISHLKYAARNGVDVMTVDDELELYKVKKHFPTAKLVLRIRADCPDVLLPLGVKYGCTISMAKDMLHIAASLGLTVVGVSFHVGSDCQNPSSYLHALELAYEVFHYADTVGYHLTLLDIGGGYPGSNTSDDLFREMAICINQGLKLFQDFPDLKVIAEPGRYFACSTHTIAVNVICKKRLPSTDGSLLFMYYVNDGVYGSFNGILYENAVPVPKILNDCMPCQQYNASIWGPTCDGVDKLCESIVPELDVGDWLYFDNMGAYSVCAFSSFNGFLRPPSYYFIREADSEKFKTLHGICSREGVVTTVCESTAPTECHLDSPQKTTASTKCHLAVDQLSQPLTVY